MGPTTDPAWVIYEPDMSNVVRSLPPEAVTVVLMEFPVANRSLACSYTFVPAASAGPHVNAVAVQSGPWLPVAHGSVAAPLPCPKVFCSRSNLLGVSVEYDVLSEYRVWHA